jgi:PPOX class probable F420-dependent enzyme
MPGYPVEPGEEGLLPWDWAVERLASSLQYWVATVCPDGRPAVTPVWGVWHDGAVWFSCGGESRKARNLANDPRLVVTTNDATEPVLVEGVAERRHDRAEVERFARQVSDKYGTPYDPEFFARHAFFRVAPATVIAMAESAFNDSPTRWTTPAP